MEIRNYKPTMRYRPFGTRTDVLVSMLGIGAMRLPLTPEGVIDEIRAIDLIEAGLDRGINYIDTAYIYNDGASEQVVGQTLQRGWRDKVYVATKMPVWELEKPGDQAPIFSTQLERLQVEQVDFYLLHSLNTRYWQQVLRSESLAWLDEEKRRGRIRFAGFSFHDDFDVFRTIVDAYDWDFCQIQYNYAQHDIQAGTRGLKYAYEKGLGIAIMEPLFGGFLTGPQMPPGASRLFEENGVNPVAGALRWIWNQPEPAVVLSGMSEKYQVKENLRIVETADVGVLTERERQVLEQVCRYMRENVPIPCSKCGYCLKSCPVGIKIPAVFDLYNKHLLVNRKHTLQPALYRGMLPSEKASACIQCGACKKHCPQSIDIPAWLEKVAAEFESDGPK
ncbi:MAG TPA: aldo/keto reductase [Kiritimatiellia bacterium]|nr:aldo/keto reductase [Kiritimatiellia bacterium]HRR32908.1 aldo/keto reductase [Kiritimatiellia bacterium]HRU69927.1 aldo/keto reductase [Kiritimatiellia bacterium]